MFTQGKISFEEYVNALDSDSVMPKVKLEGILKKRKESEQHINALEQQATQMKQQAQMQMINTDEINQLEQIGNNMINQATVM